MKKNKFLFMIVILLGVSVFSACKSSENKITKEESTQVIAAKQVSDLNENEFQLMINLPFIEDEFDDSVLTNDLVQFKAFKGSGVIYIKTKNLETLKFFVNNKEIEVNNLVKNNFNEIDISEYTKDGENVLQCPTVIEGENEVEIAIPYPEVSEDVKKSDDKFELLDQIISAEVDAGFPGAQLVVIKNGDMIKNSNYGYVSNYNSDGSPISEKERVKITDKTLFDLASNTKMYSVNYALQKLFFEGEFQLTDKVSQYIPEFKDKTDDKIKGKDTLTIQEILQHQAGFPADPQYHNDNYDPTAEDKKGENKLFSQDKETTLKQIINTPLEYEPGTDNVYSDVDYMLLGFIIEKIVNQPLDKYVEENIYQPLGLKNIVFNPLEKGFDKENIAATELNGNTRDGVIHFKNERSGIIQGTVHDEKAYYAMNGVSGHAGLFANATDLAKLGQIMINGGGIGNHKLFDLNTVDIFSKPSDSNPTFALGWRREADDGYGWAFSNLASSSTVGHTGWVGTLTVLDKENDLVIVLLTNKKNSPVLDNQENPNKFLGDFYLTGNYGLVTSLIYDALNGQNDEADNQKLLSLIENRYELYKNNESYKNEPNKKILSALLEVVYKREENSNIIKDFTKTEVYKEMKNNVK